MAFSAAPEEATKAYDPCAKFCAHATVIISEGETAGCDFTAANHLSVAAALFGHLSLVKTAAAQFQELDKTVTIQS